MQMFLAPIEVKQLTGTHVLIKQVQWLSERGFIFEIGFDEKPKLLRSYVESRMSSILIEKIKAKSSGKEALLALQASRK